MLAIILAATGLAVLGVLNGDAVEKLLDRALSFALGLVAGQITPKPAPPSPPAAMLLALVLTLGGCAAARPETVRAGVRTLTYGARTLDAAEDLRWQLTGRGTGGKMNAPTRAAAKAVRGGTVATVPPTLTPGRFGPGR